MAIEPTIGHGAEFERSDDGLSSGTFAPVGQIIDLTPPSISRDTPEITHMGSTEKWREFIGGLKDAGEGVIEINFDPSDATTAAFLSDINTDTAGYYKITFPDTTAWGFSGFATGFTPGTPIDDRMTASFTVKLSGKPGFIA